MADGTITVSVSTQDAQKRLLYMHRENARLRRRIMADALASDAAAASVAKLAQSLAEAKAEIERLRAALLKIEAGYCIDPRTVARDALGPNVEVSGCLRAPMPEDAPRTAAGSPLDRPVGPVAGA